LCFVLVAVMLDPKLIPVQENIMDIVNIASWLGLFLMAILVLGIARPNCRAVAILTLLIATPLHALPAAADNQANTAAQTDRWIPSSPVDAVALYIIPTDGIPDEGAASVARALTKDTGLWVKSALWTPSGVEEPFAGTNQYPVDDYLSLGVKLSGGLYDAGPRTYFIVLTDRDINSRSQNFRFLYSSHNPMGRTSVLSIARLVYEKDGTPSADDVVSMRVQKMLLRIVGEIKLGWKRSNDPKDLMYSPIMSIEDVDRMSLKHTVQAKGQLTSAERFQSYEAGTHPIRSRIETINTIASAIEARLTVPDISPAEKELRTHCLQQYASEKKQLEEDLEAGRKISQLPWVTFLTPEGEQECIKGLTIQSGGTR
jgi:predicted Zn-dependent protease